MNLALINKTIVKKSILFLILLLVVGSVVMTPLSHTSAQVKTDAAATRAAASQSKANATSTTSSPPAGSTTRTQEIRDAGNQSKAAAEGTTWLVNPINAAAAALGNFAIRICSAFLWMSGVLLNVVVYLSIERMGDMVANDFIRGTWTILRDLVNILFIFGLLFIAIKTIMQSWGSATKALLKNIIIAGLLINFSFFFTSVLIDVSNVITVRIYDSMGDCRTSSDVSWDNGISNCWMNAMKLTTVYKQDGSGSTESALTSVNEADTFPKILQATFFGSIFILIAATVFGAVAIMLLVRFIILVFLLITSPVMFAGMILPNLSGVTKKWMSSLQANLLFAPLLFLFLFISYKIAGENNLLATIEIGDGRGTGLSWAQTFLGNGIQVLINYLVIIGFLIGSMVIAKSVGDSVTSKSMGWGGKVAGAGFGLSARGGRFMARKFESKFGSRFAIKTDADGNALPDTRRNALARAGLKKISNSSLDIRNTRGAKGIADALGLALGENKGGGYANRDAVKQKFWENAHKDVGQMTETERRERDVLRQQLATEYAAEFKAIKTIQKNIETLTEEQKGHTKDSDGYKAIAQKIADQHKGINNIRVEIKNNDKSTKDKSTKIEAIEGAGKKRQQAFLDRIAHSNSKFAEFLGEQKAAHSIMDSQAKKEKQNDTDKLISGITSQIKKEDK